MAGVHAIDPTLAPFRVRNVMLWLWLETSCAMPVAMTSASSTASARRVPKLPNADVELIVIDRLPAIMPPPPTVAHQASDQADT